MSSSNAGFSSVKNEASLERLNVNELATSVSAASRASVLGLLGLKEYADDTAAGNAGLATGELFFSTAESKLVSKV